MEGRGGQDCSQLTFLCNSCSSISQPRGFLGKACKLMNWKIVCSFPFSTGVWYMKSSPTATRKYPPQVLYPVNVTLFGKKGLCECDYVTDSERKMSFWIIPIGPGVPSQASLQEGEEGDSRQKRRRNSHTEDKTKWRQRLEWYHHRPGKLGHPPRAGTDKELDSSL